MITIFNKKGKVRRFLALYNYLRMICSICRSQSSDSRVLPPIINTLIQVNINYKWA